MVIKIKSKLFAANANANDPLQQQKLQLQQQRAANQQTSLQIKQQQAQTTQQRVAATQQALPSKIQQAENSKLKNQIRQHSINQQKTAMQSRSIAMNNRLRLVKEQNSNQILRMSKQKANMLAKKPIVKMPKRFR